MPKVEVDPTEQPFTVEAYQYLREQEQRPRLSSQQPSPRTSETDRRTFLEYLISKGIWGGTDYDDIVDPRFEAHPGQCRPAFGHSLADVLTALQIDVDGMPLFYRVIDPNPKAIKIDTSDRPFEGEN